MCGELSEDRWRGKGRGVGEGAEDADAAVMGQKVGHAGFFGSGRGGGLVEEDAGDAQSTMTCGLEGEQGVIEGAEGGAGHDEEGGVEVLDEVDGEEIGGQGDEEAASPFDEGERSLVGDALQGLGDAREVGRWEVGEVSGGLGGCGGRVAEGADEVEVEVARGGGL